MCSTIQLLLQTKNGSISKCTKCEMYQLIYGQFTFEFTERELGNFSVFLTEIDISYWENRYDHRMIKRKIPIPTRQENLFIMLDREEFRELRRLLFYNEKEETNSPFGLSVNDINYDIFLN